MKSYLSLCAEVMVLIPLMISGPGCAQTYVPRRYYGTTYTTVPRVYMSQPVVRYSQPVVTYSQPVVRYSQPVVTYSQPAVTYSQPFLTYGTPSYQYRTAYSTVAQPYRQVTAQQTVSQPYDVNARTAEMSRQKERQTAEIEARVKRETQEIEERVRRQTEEFERQAARRTAGASRRVAQSARSPTYTAAARSSPSTAKDLTCAETGWMGKLPPDVTYFPRVALGDGFVPHAFANDMAALLVWPVSVGDDIGNAVRNLVAVKDYLRRTEPAVTIGMMLLVRSGRVPDVDKWQAQGVQCVEASQFAVFSAKFFSRATAQPSSNSTATDGSTPACEDERETSGESRLGALVAKVREWGTVVTDFLQTAPWWVWVSGVALLFVVVFLLSVRDARSQPFQTRDDDPWVIDPADN